MINLINNAIKFTEQGGISLRSRQKDDHVLIEVQDTGIGIPPEQLETIFQEFTQVDTPPPAKQAVQAWACQSAAVWLNCTVDACGPKDGHIGEGSTFLVDLP